MKSASQPGYLERLCVGTLAPAPLGALVLAFLNAIDEFGRHRFDIQAVLGMLLFWIAISAYAYLFAGVQSVLYAVLMEYVINPRFRSDAAAIVSSAFLGALAAAAMTLFSPQWKIGSVGAMIVLGVIVGATVGYILRRMYKRQLVASS